MKAEVVEGLAAEGAPKTTKAGSKISSENVGTRAKSVRLQGRNNGTTRELGTNVENASKEPCNPCQSKEFVKNNLYINLDHLELYKQVECLHGLNSFSEAHNTFLTVNVDGGKRKTSSTEAGAPKIVIDNGIETVGKTKINTKHEETVNFVLTELSIKLTPISRNYDDNVVSDRGNIKCLKLLENSKNKEPVRDNIRVILNPLKTNIQDMGRVESLPVIHDAFPMKKIELVELTNLSIQSTVCSKDFRTHNSTKLESKSRGFENLIVKELYVKLTRLTGSHHKNTSEEHPLAFATHKEKDIPQTKNLITNEKYAQTAESNVDCNKNITKNIKIVLDPLSTSEQNINRLSKSPKGSSTICKENEDDNVGHEKENILLSNVACQRNNKVVEENGKNARKIKLNSKNRNVGRKKINGSLVPLGGNFSENKTRSKQKQVACMQPSVETNKLLNKEDVIVKVSKTAGNEPKQIKTAKRKAPLKINVEDMESVPLFVQKYNIGVKKGTVPKSELSLSSKILTAQVPRDDKNNKNSNKEPQFTSKNNNKETENLLLKQSHNKLVVVVNKNKNPSINKQLKVTFQPLSAIQLDTQNLSLDMEKGKDTGIHNLRNLQPKNYVEESVLENSTEIFPSSDLEKKNLPVYRRTLLKEPKAKLETEDLYEFTDFSPKVKKTVKSHRQHRSSILFDKDTHEIMKKLEENEAKTKKKVARTRKKLGKKKYDKIVEKIVSKVKQKILSKNSLIQPALSKPKDVNLVQNENQNFETYNHGKITHISNFEEDINIILHSSSVVPSNSDESVPIPVNISQNPITVTTRKRRVSSAGESDYDNFLDTSDTDPIVLQSIGSCDNSVIQNNNDNCFGFDDALELNTPIKSVQRNPINIISNEVLKSADYNFESPHDFNLKRPNANSTMVCGPNSYLSSPWRADWVPIKRNPHFLSLKSNALPRIDQEMVLDHTLVETYESACKTPVRHDDTPAKKQSVQQSILDYVDSNIEKENEVRRGSLYDYEEFISPEKQVKTRDRDKVKGVKRNILGDEDYIVSSTPIRRRALTDISNFSEELKDPNSQNITYFGFNESNQNSLNKTPEKHRKNCQNRVEDDKENDKPFRFDIDKLRSYSKKTRNIRKKATAETQATLCEDQNKSDSLLEVSSEEHCGEIHLFEEPEEILDNMSPPHINEERPRRKRLDSCDSDTSECGTKRKKHKKTKLELEQEAWIKEFNAMCEEVENHELELE